MMTIVASSSLLCARTQMALTLGFHIVLACLGVGLPDEESRITRYAIEMPGGLSWMAFGDADAVGGG